MEDYILKENETILFRGSARLIPDANNLNAGNECHVLLTNLNFVFISTFKRLFRTVNEVEAYSVSDVKIYDEAIQIIRRKSVVDIYLKQREIFLDFGKDKYAKEFCDKALRLISGFSKFVRSVKKTKKTINETNEALDIDIVDMAKRTATFACEVTVGVTSLDSMGKGAKIAGKIASVILNKSKNSPPMLPAKDEGTKED